MKNVKEITITIEGESWQKALDKAFKKKNKEAVLCFFLKRKNNDIKNGSEFTDPLFPCHCFR